MANMNGLDVLAQFLDTQYNKGMEKPDNELAQMRREHGQRPHGFTEHCADS